MKKVTHTRKGKQIIDLSTGVVEDFRSVNQSKKRSRKIQQEGGILRRLTRKLKDRISTFDSLAARPQRVRR